MQRETDSSALATSENIGTQLCDALGLDKGRNITRVVLNVESDSMVTVEVTQLVTQRQGLAVCDLLTQRFELVQREAWRSPIKADDSAPV